MGRPRIENWVGKADYLLWHLWHLLSLRFVTVVYSLTPFAFVCTLTPIGSLLCEILSPWLSWTLDTCSVCSLQSF